MCGCRFNRTRPHWLSFGWRRSALISGQNGQEDAEGMVKDNRILVIGGGIGGLSAAIGLHQKGFDVDVVELSTDWRVYHVGIIVQANFVRALAALDLGDEAVAAGFPYKGWKFLDMAGEEIAELPGDSTVTAPYPADLGLTRPALHKVLTGKVKALGIPVRLGVTFETIEDRGDGVDVRFTDGTTGRYDLVIGADGAYSKTRNIVFPDAPRPRYTGQGVWRYNVPRPKDLEWFHLYMHEDGHTAGYCPLTQDTMYIMTVTEEPGNPHFPPESLADEMRKRLAGFGGLLGELARRITEPELVVYRPLEVCMLPSPWYKGRILLIGDAAHSATPHLGQGAAMAIEDSVALADELSRDEAPLADKLARFMTRRFERANLVGQTSIKLGEWQMNPAAAEQSQAEVTAQMRAKLLEPI